MNNLARELDAVHERSPIEAIVLLPIESGSADDFGAGKIPRYAETPFGRTMTWPEARPWLDYEYDDDDVYATQRCHSLYAWTADAVWFVAGDGDGSVWLESAPRHPEAPPKAPPKASEARMVWNGPRWIGPVPGYCDLCDAPLSFDFVDGRVGSAGGHWAYMCLSCHSRHGGRLGTGLGQRYSLVRGVWQKTAG